MSTVSWTLRIVGLTIVFVFTAAPLPGDTPGCDAPGGVDDSAALEGDGPIRALCGEHCYADCHRLVDCGRYTGDSGYSACVAECTGADGRDCVNHTFSATDSCRDYDPDTNPDACHPLCAAYPDGVVTQYEHDLCLGDARAANCSWCTGTENCWDPSMDVPFNCTALGLCDAR